MKILYIITQSEIGGAQQYLLTLLKYINRQRFAPFVTAPEIPGEIFPQLRKYQVPIFPLKYLQRSISLSKDLKAITELRQIIKNIKPDCVHLLSSKAGFIGAIAARLEKVPSVVYRIGGFAFHEDVSLLKKLFYFLAEVMSGFLKDKIIVNNLVDLTIMQKIFARKTILIPNGLDENIIFLARKAARQKLNLPHDVWVTGTIANFYPNKGLLDLLATINSNNSLYCIIGDGIMREEIENYISHHKLKDRVRLYGRLENAAQYLKAFDIFVLPSHKEGMPWSILEAFAARVPVIATKVGGIPLMMRDGIDGLSVDAKQPSQLSAAIEKLLNNTELINNFTSNAYEHLKRNFSAMEMVKATEACYGTLY